MYKNKFKHLNPKTIKATASLISKRPWLWNPEAIVQWLEEVSAIYQIPCPSLIISPRFCDKDCYISELNLIILSKCSVFTLLHEFRHALKGDDEEDARGWSCSLVYQANPTFYRNAVRKGLVLYW